MKLALLLWMLLAMSLQAFPPAPNHTIYGMVRDQYGQVIGADGAALILLKGDEEIGRTSIKSGVRLDQNYELNIRLDQDLAGTLYSEKAVSVEGSFSLVVDLDGTLFYPIEVSRRG